MTNFSPIIRPRRNRKSPWIRELFAETILAPSDFILPLFVIEGKNKEEKIAHLPGVSRLSIDLLIKKAKEAAKLGIPALMIFPSIDQKLKTADGKEALNKKNLICRAIAELKKSVPEIGVICDVALDPFTSHGHDGVIGKNGDVDNDATIAILCEQAIAQAEAGCDINAPSDMMDGRIAAIRDALDDAEFSDVGIMSYAAKYASNFYGPFRHAVGSINNLARDKVGIVKNKKTYQMDFRNSDEALHEVALDIEEGADSIIIKPGMPYLDIISRIARQFNFPTIAYQVSGEYAMLKHAATAGAFDFDDAMLESLLAFKRAGCRAVITYAAVEMAKKLS
jgi:porphobilinogen synthase